MCRRVHRPGHIDFVFPYTEVSWVFRPGIGFVHVVQGQGQIDFVF